MFFRAFRNYRCRWCFTWNALLHYVTESSHVNGVMLTITHVLNWTSAYIGLYHLKSHFLHEKMTLSELKIIKKTCEVHISPVISIMSYKFLAQRTWWGNRAKRSFAGKKFLGKKQAMSKCRALSMFSSPMPSSSMHPHPFYIVETKNYTNNASSQIYE